MELELLRRGIDNPSTPANPGFSIFVEGVENRYKGKGFEGMAFLTQGAPSLSFNYDTLQNSDLLGIADLLEVAVPTPSDREKFWAIIDMYWQKIKAEMVVRKGNWRNVRQAKKSDRALPSMKFPEYDTFTIEYLMDYLRIYIDTQSFTNIITNVRGWITQLLRDRSDQYFVEGAGEVKRIRNIAFIPVGMGGYVTDGDGQIVKLLRPSNFSKMGTWVTRLYRPSRGEMRDEEISYAIALGLLSRALRDLVSEDMLRKSVGWTHEDWMALAATVLMGYTSTGKNITMTKVFETTNVDLQMRAYLGTILSTARTKPPTDFDSWSNYLRFCIILGFVATEIQGYVFTYNLSLSGRYPSHRNAENTIKRAYETAEFELPGGSGNVYLPPVTNNWWEPDLHPLPMLMKMQAFNVTQPQPDNEMNVYDIATPEVREFTTMELHGPKTDFRRVNSETQAPDTKTYDFLLKFSNDSEFGFVYIGSPQIQNMLMWEFDMRYVIPETDSEDKTAEKRVRRFLMLMKFMTTGGTHMSKAFRISETFGICDQPDLRIKSAGGNYLIVKKDDKDQMVLMDVPVQQADKNVMVPATHRPPQDDRPVAKPQMPEAGLTQNQVPQAAATAAADHKPASTGDQQPTSE